ncbi:hypothetical protein R1sor_010569 [Riccia sorocarpa]|uniref:EF-hand domain-containing protein n=1 Tax=Riccia sorocarpa TaxID=122646 RepID=A0ABD3HYG5_9MARC
MGVVFIDGTTVRDFVKDEEAFHKAVDPLFVQLDTNKDGVLSRSELRPAFERLALIETHLGVPDYKTPEELKAIYDEVFEKFDTDHNETVDHGEFREQIKEILLAVADGLGDSPLNMVVDDDSLLARAVEREEAENQRVKNDRRYYKDELLYINRRNARGDGLIKFDQRQLAIAIACRWYTGLVGVRIFYRSQYRASEVTRVSNHVRSGLVGVRIFYRSQYRARLKMASCVSPRGLWDSRHVTPSKAWQERTFSTAVASPDADRPNTWTLWFSEVAPGRVNAKGAKKFSSVVGVRGGNHRGTRVW